VDHAPDKPIAASGIPWPSGDPNTVIRNDLDAKILAVLWAVRKAWMPLLWLGASIAVVYFIIINDPEAFTKRFGEVVAPGEMLDALASPFPVVAIAVATRIGVAFAALGAAYPLTRVNTPDDYPQTNRLGRYFRMWWDRWQMSRAYRAQRWSWSVRNAVLDRMGAWGTLWQRWDLLMLVANILLFIVFFALLLLMTAQLPD
jgi:hypothetical protein